MDYQKSLVIHGSGGHGRSVADVAIAAGVEQILFVYVEARAGMTLFGFPVLPGVPETAISFRHVAAAGDNRRRAEIFAAILGRKWPTATVIAPTATVSKTATIGRGVFIGHGAHVGPMACIGDNSIVNTHAVVEHDCVVGKHCHVSVSAAVAGGCSIGDFSFIGAGATVINGLSICPGVVVGAGATVIEAISEPGTYVGTPARKR